MARLTTRSCFVLRRSMGAVGHCVRNCTGSSRHSAIACRQWRMGGQKRRNPTPVRKCRICLMNKAEAEMQIRCSATATIHDLQVTTASKQPTQNWVLYHRSTHLQLVLMWAVPQQPQLLAAQRNFGRPSHADRPLHSPLLVVLKPHAPRCRPA